MSNGKYDAETEKALSEAEALEAMFNGSGWKVAERFYLQMIEELKDITLIDPEETNLDQTIRDRINTVRALEHWLSELKGQVNNAVLMKTEQKTDPLMERR